MGLNGRPGGVLIVAGTLVLAGMGAIAWMRPGPGEPAFMAAVGTALAGYVIALARLARGAHVSRRLLLLCLLMALAGRGALLTIPSGPAGDAIRYIWDARVQRAGLDPYRVRPDDPALEWLHTDLTRAVDAAWLPTIYPPVAQLYFRLVASVHESIEAFRVAAVVCDALVVLVLLAVLSATGHSRGWVLAYAWHPLVAIEGAAGAHVDFAGVLALVVSWLALVRGRRAIAAVAFAAAVLVKPLPLVLAPLYWRRIRRRDALLGIGVAAAAVVAVSGGAPPMGSLGAFVEQFRFNNPLFSVLERLADPRTITAGAVLAGVLLAARLRATRGSDAADAWSWPMAAALVAAPVIYPWYLVWLTPFLAGRGSLPLLAWTVSIAAVYPVWHLAELGAPFAVPARLLAIEFGVPVAAALWLGLGTSLDSLRCRWDPHGSAGPDRTAEAGELET